MGVNDQRNSPRFRDEMNNRSGAESRQGDSGQLNRGSETESAYVYRRHRLTKVTRMWGEAGNENPHH